jgi:hypothetical protein
VTTAVIVALARRTLEREFKNPVLDYERELDDDLINTCAEQPSSGSPQPSSR